MAPLSESRPERINRRIRASAALLRHPHNRASQFNLQGPGGVRLLRRQASTVSQVAAEHLKARARLKADRAMRNPQSLSGNLKITRVEDSMAAHRTDQR